MKRQDSTRVFLWLVYCFLAVVWLMAMLDSRFRQSPWPILFTILMLLHAVLHSLVNWETGILKHRALYVATQTILAGALVLMDMGSALTPALFFPLAGETFALFPSLRGRLWALGAIVAVWLGAMWAGGSRAVFWTFLPGAAIAFAFVGIYVTLFSRQMVERQRAERLAAELDQANRQLRSYAMRVEELTITAERQRMARELHDTLAQGLAGLVLQLEAVDDLLGRGEGERARAIAGRAMQRARTTLAEARTAIAALRSPVEQGDVIPTVEALVADLRKEAGLSCLFEAEPGDLRLDGAMGEQLCRVVKESLTNIRRHARASQAVVRLSATEAEVRLEVTDNGAGFDPAAIGTGHFGLVGMMERVQLLGGSFLVESSPGKGTRILATLPRTPEIAEED